MRRNSGFTLMELLIAVGLSILLLTAIVVAFHRSMDVIRSSTARVTIVENARIAMDAIGTDLDNMVPAIPRQTSGPSETTSPQRMMFRSYARQAETVDGVAVPAGTNADGSCDYLGFTTTASAPSGSGAPGRSLRTVYVEYLLARDHDGESTMSGPGTLSSLRSRRPIFVLKRRVWALPNSLSVLDSAQAGGLPIFAPYPAGLTAPATIALPGPVGSTMPLLEEADLCHWVVSFNVELFVYDPSKSPIPAFHELDDPAHPYTASVMPLGDGKPYQPQPFPPAMKVEPEPEAPRKFRITLRVIEGAGERQERIVQREFAVR